MLQRQRLYMGEEARPLRVALARRHAVRADNIMPGLPRPAKDIYHDAAKNALIQDGWTITHAPFVLRWGTTDVFIDLGAKQLLAAEKQERKITLEVKSFVGRSDVDDLEKTLGQYILYHDILSKREPERVLYLAVYEEVWLGIFEKRLASSC